MTHDDLAVTIGARLRKARNAEGIGMIEAAAALGLPKTTLARLETGSGVLSLQRLIDYAKLVGARPLDFAPELAQPHPLRWTAAERAEALHYVDVGTLAMLTELTGVQVAYEIRELQGGIQ
jgi:transcriptional regulator with XRE-family HTH domain